jgi:hypothetical protein
MKIVNLTDFLALPAGTLFAKYEPHIAEGFYIKRESVMEIRDFYYTDLAMPHMQGRGPDHMAAYEKMIAGMSGQPDFTIIGRDGCFVEDQLFLVWEQHDFARLVLELVDLPAFDPSLSHTGAASQGDAAMRAIEVMWRK